MMYTILAVDDDPESLGVLQQFLTQEGYRVSTSGSARQALHMVEQSAPSLMLVNTNLPGLDGLTLCRRLRTNPATVETPVIFMMPPGSSFDVTTALEAGGDDFIRKPFALRELSARIRAHLRRTNLGRIPEDTTRLTILPYNLSVLVNERKVALTQVEFELLMYLSNTPNQLHSTENLLMGVWRYPHGAGDAALVRNHIRNLRRKIEDDPERPAIILSRHGRGYTVKAHVQIENQPSGGAR
jgi:two-component system response regulator VicR